MAIYTPHPYDSTICQGPVRSKKQKTQVLACLPQVAKPSLNVPMFP